MDKFNAFKTEITDDCIKFFDLRTSLHLSYSFVGVQLQQTLFFSVHLFEVENNNVQELNFVNIRIFYTALKIY